MEFVRVVFPPLLRRVGTFTAAFFVAYGVPQTLAEQFVSAFIALALITVDVAASLLAARK